MRALQTVYIKRTLSPLSQVSLINFCQILTVIADNTFLTSKDNDFINFLYGIASNAP